MKTAPLPWAAAATELRRARTVLLAIHQRPDGDALGSELALASFLKGMGARTWVGSDDPVPERYLFLPGAASVLGPRARLPARFDLAVLIECANPARAGGFGKSMRRARRVLNIDHHPGNADYGDVNLVAPDAPATVLLAERLREELGVPLTPQAAVNFYAGLFTETGGFRYANTTPEVLALASRFVTAGASPSAVAEMVYGRVPPRRYRLLGRALGSLSLDRTVSWMSLSLGDFAETGSTEEDSEEFVEYARSVRGARIAVFLREIPGGVRASLRSRIGTAVNLVARRFGGGGHAYAAGCTLKGVTLAEARRKLGAALGVRRSPR
jgi:phosphoesterase RecJ-like protein